MEKWVYGGAGLGRVEGQVTLIPFVLPGEEVSFAPVRKRAGLVEARATDWTARHEQRVEPQCSHFARCGGCHYQMAPYEMQIAQKVEILREVLQRVGKLDAPAEIGTLSGEPWGYRNRSQFHFGDHVLGFKAAGTDRVVDVDQCPISSPAINEALKKLRGMRRDRNFPRFLKEVELFTNGERTMVNVLQTEQNRHVAKGFFEWLGQGIPGAADGMLEYKAAGETFRVSHKSFFQVNRFLMDSMVDCALAGAEVATALDLYAGVGLFTIPLARKAGKVTGVESDGSAARDLEFNAQRAGVKVEALRLQSEQYLEGIEKTPDFILADPPRSGLGKQVVKHLERLKAPRLTLVSCDPATLARDLAPLIASGYRLEKLTLADLFPQTYHIETIASLQL
ncbi:MAG: class I SAM-dependent RNA methyltransferase [Acidobacteria bacterium]|nr:class I SAM-dependent RNA methyltransferase [Acidobacteriota bacterium]